MINHSSKSCIYLICIVVNSWKACCAVVVVNLSPCHTYITCLTQTFLRKKLIKKCLLNRYFGNFLFVFEVLALGGKLCFCFSHGYQCRFKGIRAHTCGSSCCWGEIYTWYKSNAGVPGKLSFIIQSLRSLTKHYLIFFRQFCVCVHEDGGVLHLSSCNK